MVVRTIRKGLPMARLTSPDELRRIIAEPRPTTRAKILDALDEQSIDFLKRCPFALVGTTAADGTVEVSTLTRLIDNMEKRGLVARRRDHQDARAIVLHVTSAGRRLTQRIVPIAERYETVALAGFNGAETRTLKAALRRLYANMEGLERS